MALNKPVRKVVARPVKKAARRPAPAEPRPVYTSDLMTVPEVAEALRVCNRTVYRLAASEELRSLRIGRAIRFDPRDVYVFIANQKVGA